MTWPEPGWKPPPEGFRYEVTFEKMPTFIAVPEPVGCWMRNPPPRLLRKAALEIWGWSNRTYNRVPLSQIRKRWREEIWRPNHWLGKGPSIERIIEDNSLKQLTESILEAEDRRILLHIEEIIDALDPED